MESRTVIRLVVTLVVAGLAFAAGWTAGRDRERAVLRELQARVAVRDNNARSIREVARSYRLDRGESPCSIADLVAAGLLRAVPIEPMSGRAEGWIEVRGAATEHCPGGELVDVDAVLRPPS
jgi:hypothetical protein